MENRKTDDGKCFAVRLEAPARLHVGFVDVSGSLGRRFGSLGLTLEQFATVLELHRADRFEVHGPQADRASGYLRRLLDDHDPPTSVTLRIHQAIPEHVGLGSGTQLALAVGKAFGALFHLPLSVAALAARLDRGARSGIGIGAFEEGGFVLDGGRSVSGGYPPVIARLAFPASWRVLLVFDRARRGLYGEAERAAFRALPAFPQPRAAHLAHLVLMRLLPALAEEDFGSFSDALGEIQRAVGDHFAAAQGGRFASPAVGDALAWLESRGVAGTGQTSWGPTGFAVVDSEVRAHALLVEARERFGAQEGLEFAVVRGRNRGHRMELLSEAEAGIQSVRRDGTVAPHRLSNRTG
ncbi:MAG TPA: beta-ribofuranosylaminobenzene 5'-phosphate synthase family protein [Burkholderiales bacterium]|nr:beta-ribofuranosylaminobenzene 5'-phosphate synthase family protein [Burkholderiales bacterium]